MKVDILICFPLWFFFSLNQLVYGYDGYTSCSKPSRKSKDYWSAVVPCDLNSENWCVMPGKAYPWRAVQRFVRDNHGLMKRMYGDQRHSFVLRSEFEYDNEVELESREYSNWHGSHKGGDFTFQKFHSQAFAPPVISHSSGRSASSSNDVWDTSSSSPTSTPTEHASTTSTTFSTTPTSTTSTPTTTPSSTNISVTTSNAFATTIIPAGTSTDDDFRLLDNVTMAEITFSTILEEEEEVSDGDVEDYTTPEEGTTSFTTAVIGTEEAFRNVPLSTVTTSEVRMATAPSTRLSSTTTTTTTSTTTTVTPEEIATPSNSSLEPLNTGVPKPLMFEESTTSTTKVPNTKNKGINACPVKEEVVAPFWANNTRGEILALLNLYPFEQYVHWERCSHEHKQMYCRQGCRCEQQYRLHRLLAYDPSNDCRGIFSDWFKFPSCCVCKCYDIPVAEFRHTSRSPRFESHENYARFPPYFPDDWNE